MKEKWYKICTIVIFIFSFCLRFWGLDRYNGIVFDESFYAKFGYRYMTGDAIFTSHPPMGQYIIAIGIWIGNKLPISQNSFNGLSGWIQSPWSYRCANAFVGSCVPLLMILLSYQLSHRPVLAILSGFFTALDGLFVVESRYSLINIYTIFFGLLGHWQLLLALNSNNCKRWFAMLLSGIFFGASIGSKWNGLYFTFGICLLWLCCWIIHLLQIRAPKLNQALILNLPKFVSMKRADSLNELILSENPLSKMIEINVFQFGFFQGVVTLITYLIIWIPHMMMDPNFSYIEMHQQIFEYHRRTSSNFHNYCTQWYQWPILHRHLCYFYAQADTFIDGFPMYGPFKNTKGDVVHYGVYGMGNPFLWWFGTATIIYMIVMLIGKLILPAIKQKRFFIERNFNTDIWIILYLVGNFIANLLPWMAINRCLFIYHYMTAIVFKFIALAWFVDKCLTSRNVVIRILGLSIILIIIASFFFWMPFIFGIPLFGKEYYKRIWLRSWI